MEIEVQSELKTLIENMYKNCTATTDLPIIIDKIIDNDTLDFKEVFQRLVINENERLSLITEKSEIQLLRIIQNNKLSKVFIIELLDGYWSMFAQVFESLYKKDIFLNLLKIYTKTDNFKENKDEVIKFIQGHEGWKSQDELLNIFIEE